MDTFKNNINIWYNEYLNNGLDAIISKHIWLWHYIKRLWFYIQIRQKFQKKS